MHVCMYGYVDICVSGCSMHVHVFVHIYMSIYRARASKN